MTENDLRLLGNVLRLARDVANDMENSCEECWTSDAEALLDALDQFKFRASFQVPE